MSTKKTDRSVEILGVTINGTQKAEVLKRVWLQRKNLLHLATVNPEFVMEARRNDRFRSSLAQAELRVADGWGLIWAGRILGLARFERISGTEIVEEILKRADSRGEKVFLLGARPGIAEVAADAMKKKYPGAEYGWFEGARTVKLEKQEEASMTIAKINAFEPDYLLVAYGSPWQDIWIEENREYLRARVAVGIGGVLDEWAGLVRPTATWLDRIGGKWLWRWVTEPKRTKRILRVFRFASLVWIHKVID
jgi:N-acetylglucosaminyldiphosphoundecaprenol N-acetyl-beta-D-mannosaminyltransferase